MVLINSQGYNIADVEILTKLIAGESTIIGTIKDYESLRSFAETGSMQVKCTLAYDGNDMVFDGSVDCNLFETGIEFYTTIYPGPTVTGGDPILVGGQLFMDGSNMKCHINVTPVSGGSSGLESRVEAIEDVIPSDATEENKLATMSDIPSGGEYVEVTVGDVDEPPTYAEVLNSLFELADTSKITDKSCLNLAGIILSLVSRRDGSNSQYEYSRTTEAAGIMINVVKVSSNSSASNLRVNADGYSKTDISSASVSANSSYRLYY